ncbi:hypothetical protein WG908_06790 [Sphingobium sp. AN641]|uniref:hypothetical protein n=1 Tax=Sphingobium sp. AN641 TaxID=3133443 RepID=UPI0030BB6F4A
MKRAGLHRRSALLAARPGKDQAACLALPNLRRATSAAAAAPNSRTIGGAGTSVPPLEELPPELELLDELDEELDVLLEPLDDPVLPKLDDPPDDELDEDEPDDVLLLPDDPPWPPFDPCPPFDP